MVRVTTVPECVSGYVYPGRPLRNGAGRAAATDRRTVHPVVWSDADVGTIAGMRHPRGRQPDRTRRGRITVCLAGTLVLLTACSSAHDSGETVQRPAASASPAVTVERAQPAGSSVKVDRVDLPRSTTGGSGGVVAVCADANGVVGTCDGFATVANGITLDVTIHTPTPLAAGPYIVGLYEAHGLPSGSQHPTAMAMVQLT